MKLAVALLISSASAAKAKSRCPFGHGAPADNLAQITAEVEQIQATYPSEILTCSAETPARTTTSLTQAQYQNAVSAVIDLYDQQTDMPKVDFAGCLIRFSGHDFMDYRVGSGGGADGCMNFSDGDNAGLSSCVQRSGLAGVFDQLCGQISLADFIVLAGEAVTIRTATEYDANNKFGDGTLGQQFMNAFSFGRTTVDTCADNLHRLPNPANGCGGLDDIFVQNIYAAAGENAWRFTAAINGAHTIGQARVANSGYVGFWSDEANQGIFNNNYYHSLLNKGWQPRTNVAGNIAKNQWELADDDHRETNQMMLDTDMCMVYGHNTGALLSANANCCAWLLPNTLERSGALENGDNYCGRDFNAGLAGMDRRQLTGLCCGKGTTQRPLRDCDDLNRPVGPAFNDVLDFASNEEEWLDAYVAAWKMAQENGWTGLSALTGGATAGPAANEGNTDAGRQQRERPDEAETREEEERPAREQRRGGGGRRGGRR